MTENEDITNGPQMPSARINPSAKQCKFDLDDKFGKFEIKSKMQGKKINKSNISLQFNLFIVVFLNTIFFIVPVLTIKYFKTIVFLNIIDNI